MTVAWPFIPQMDVVETLEFETDVHKCRRAEYRRGLRPLPRIFYAYSYLLDAADYAAARELRRTIGEADLYVPDWPNATQVPTIGAATVSLPVDVTLAPAYRVNGKALIWGSNTSYEVVTVSVLGTGTITISATVAGYTKPWVVPLRVGTFMQSFDGDRGPHTYSAASATFRCIDTENLSAASGGPSYPTYLGDPLVIDPVEIINGAGESNNREVSENDSVTGLVYKYPLYATPNQSAVLAWTAQSAAEVWALRVWLHKCRGRWKQFWTPSWNPDVRPASSIYAGGMTVTIYKIGFAAKYPLPTSLAILKLDGSVVGVTVTSVASGGETTEVLTIEENLESTISISSIDRISKLTLSRLASDRIDIQHLPGRQATIVAATTEVPVYP
jgi:hypothetical protein